MPGRNLFILGVNQHRSAPYFGRNPQATPPGSNKQLALRRQFGPPGMRMLQFAFGGNNDNSYVPHNFDANTFVYPGTHDNNTSHGWWREASHAERQHVRDYPPASQYLSPRENQEPGGGEEGQKWHDTDRHSRTGR